MKTILIIVLATIYLSSCTNDVRDPNEIVISKSEYNKLKGIDTLYPKAFHFISPTYYQDTDFHIILGEDKHEYLDSDGGNTYILIHYPECKLCVARYTNLMNRLETIEKNQTTAN
jgi:hypothetical protein